MLKIRDFVKGEDEEVWLTLRNEAFKEYDDFRPSTIEDMEIWEKDPGFDPVGMFIAEIEGRSVGRVQAYIDKQRGEKKGFIQGLGVVPKLRKRGIGRRLAEKAIESLKDRDMEIAQCWIRDDKPTCKHLFESLGFKVVRIFSTMRRELHALPSDMGENREVEIAVMKDNVKDKELLRWLSNETFSEHFDFRPTTIEEWKHWCTHPDFDHEGWFFARLEGKPVGYVGTWIDSKFVKHKKVKRGWIDTIGVLKPERRKGIGTTLILRGLRYLKQRGMTEVDLGVDDLNQTEAIKLYEKVGFKVVRKELTYQKKII
jgi:mycothiol synthase